MKRLRPWLVIGLVFVAGFTAGAAVTRGLLRHFVQQALTNPDRVRNLIERRMTARLRLRPDQRQQVHQILSETQGELRQLRQEFSPRFLALITNAETRISATLTPEQRERFNAFRDEHRNLWRPR